MKKLNVEMLSVQEMNQLEMGSVGGGYSFSEFWGDFKTVLTELPKLILEGLKVVSEGFKHIGAIKNDYSSIVN